MLTRVNAYNGIAYGNDPTVLAWETGNELGAYIGKEGYPPAAWTTTIAATIKSYSRSLIIDGSGGFYNYSTKQVAPGLNVANIDMMSDHGYPRNIALLQAQVPLARNANKAFFIGASPSSFLACVESQLIHRLQSMQVSTIGPHPSEESVYRATLPN